ncbi:hypothetical protein C8Q79DRAFT_999883 [Trametes meyenii]|nr:hypothetical protein C8Q79DRAFT_999883 [Trametes meyenii]
MPPLIPLQKSSSFDVSSLAGFLGGEAALSVMMLPYLYTRRKWWGWYNCPTSLNGPKYTSARLGFVLPHTGPLASLLVEGCCAVEAVEMGGRASEAVDVAIANLRREPEPFECPRVPDAHSTRLALLPIAYFRDICCAAMIFLGPVYHGLFTYQHCILPDSSPLSDGWLECQRDFVILYGTEAAVAPKYCPVTLCSLLLAFQFLLQLLLVPQGSRFGQTMFLSSLVHILACAKDNIPRRILMSDTLGKPALQKYRFGTSTAAVAFLVLALRLAIGLAVEARLHARLPSDTPVWQFWHEVVARKIQSGEPLYSEEYSLRSIEDSLLSRAFMEDAQDAYMAYLKYSSGAV